jgi:hypothetical protein
MGVCVELSEDYSPSPKHVGDTDRQASFLIACPICPINRDRGPH